MLSIVEAAAQGIERLRKPVWANPLCHLKVDIIKGKPSPWTHLYDPFNTECNGHDPIDILAITGYIDYTSKEFEEYRGPDADSVEYRAEVAKFEGCTK